MDASLPLGHRAVNIDGPGLGAQPHGRHHRRHLLHLGVGDLILPARLAHTVLDIGRGLLEEPPVHGVRVFTFWLFDGLFT